MDFSLHFVFYWILYISALVANKLIHKQATAHSFLSKFFDSTVISRRVVVLDFWSWSCRNGLGYVIEKKYGNSTFCQYHTQLSVG